MKKYSLIISFIMTLMTCFHVFAQSATIPIWKDEIPGEIKSDTYIEKEVYKDGELVKTNKVVMPTMTMYLPDASKANKTAVLILPGGGYGHLSMYKEGKKVALWFNSLGITAFVLKYRLPSDQIMKDKSIGPLQDTQEAIRIIRRNAIKWKIDPNKIGIIGFSAGGHLAATASNHYNTITYNTTDTISCRPDFCLLMYPVLSMKDEFTHKVSRRNLLGEKTSEEIINKFSNELIAGPNTRATFIIHAADDKSVPVENSLLYFAALRKNNVPAEMHIYETGGHGFGLGDEGTNAYWEPVCIRWLKMHSYLNK